MPAALEAYETRVSKLVEHKQHERNSKQRVNHDGRLSNARLWRYIAETSKLFMRHKTSARV